MSLPIRHLTAWLLLSGYLFVVTAGLTFHQHGSHSEQSCSSACHHDAAELAEICPHADHLGPDEQTPSVGASNATDDEDCPVCQFLAQKLILVRVVEKAGWEELHERPAIREPMGPVSRIPRIQHSRAPPSVV